MAQGILFESKPVKMRDADGPLLTVDEQPPVEIIVVTSLV